MTSQRTLGAHAVCIAALGSALAWSAPVRAQGASQKAAAEALFEEGRKLVAEGKVAEACPKFADSEQLDASSSTLLNLASCYEKLGRTASAWATYREAASLANANGRTEHLAVAQKRADALTPKLSRVTVAVSAPAEGLEVKRDGTPVTRAEWGLPIPMDPGAHTYEASAPGRKTWTGSVQVANEGGSATLTIPALEVLPASQIAAAPAAETPAATESGAPAPRPGSDAQAEPPRTQRVIAIVVGSVGVVALGVGTVFALGAKSKYNDSLDECRVTNKDLCTSDGVSKREDARSAGNIATAGFLVGAGALVGAGILWFTAPSTERGMALQVAPSVGTQGAGAMLRGRW